MESRNPYGPNNNYDFVLARSCSSITDIDCHLNIAFAWVDGYAIYGTSLYSKDYGKMNLDSLHSAPPDAELSDNNNPIIGNSRVFRIRQDSLEQCEGNVYAFKTTLGSPYNCPLYVKMKVLDFDILDSASHIASIKFLWVADICTGRNLITPAPVDTFPDLSIFDPQPTQTEDLSHRFATKYSGVSKALNRQIVLGNQFTVPETWGNTNSVVGIYDLNGKLVGKVNVFGKRVIDLKKELGIKAGGVWVVGIIEM